MPGLLFQIDDPLKYPGAGEIPAVLFKVNGPGKVADNGGPGQTMAGLSANAQQPAGAFTETTSSFAITKFILPVETK